MLVDGREVAVRPGATYGELAADLGLDLAEILAAEADGRVYELFRPVVPALSVRFLTFDDPVGQAVFRHTSAHIMAQALKRLYPEVRLATGPAVEDGFYYDVDLPQRLTDEDLRRVEAEMAAIVTADYPLIREEWTREEAERYFAAQGETYKLEILAGIPADAPITVYRQGEFVDLCRGPHLPSTGRVRAFALTHVAGAYWRGDERQPMLQRVYGTSFPNEDLMRAHAERLEEAKRRDHRRLGPELKLFFMHDVSPGFVFWLPRGLRLYQTLEAFSKEEQARRGYQEVATPWILRADLWRRSGHWDHYRANMFLIEEGEETMGVKPMNCPAHCLIYRSQTRSYRELPLRLAEYGPLARFERSGTLHGLLRVRGFHQDDAHIFLAEEQIQDEITEVMALLDRVYGVFGLPYRVKLSTRPEDFMGAPETWDLAEEALAQSLAKLGLSFQVAPKEGAFYGPKLDFDIIDALGRRWQCATIQLDFQLPERFDLVYTDRDGREKRPVMIHRALFGSLERFIGILIEHFGGAFPTWLAPVAARVLPISDEVGDYARRLFERLIREGFAVELDDRAEKIGYKIRQAQVEKIPYCLVVGRREAADGTVAVRARGGENAVLTEEALVAGLRREIAERSLTLTLCD